VVERLGYVVVRAELQSLHQVHRVDAGGEHHHRHVRERAQLAQDLIAVDIGQPYVEQDQVGFLLLDDVETLFPARSAEHLHVAPLQRQAQLDGFDDVRRVVDHHDPH
jgi:hypothetical protein